MSPAERQDALAQELLRIEDAQERLSYAIDRIRRRPNLPAESRVEECRIQGCATKVWLQPSIRNGRCFFETDSESAMVRGLAALVADVYNDSLPNEAAAFSATIFEAARLERMITPTRQNGLAFLQAAIRNFALSHSSNP